MVAIAQLAEHFSVVEGVMGSNPISHTKWKNSLIGKAADLKSAVT